MNEKEGLNLLDFLATGINKNDPVIQAVLSDYEGNGAVANEMMELIAFIDYYTRTDDVKKHHDDTLEMIVKQFTKLRRQVAEPDNILLRRMLSLTERKGDTIWGNCLDMKHVFETYFADIKAFVCESTNKENILANGDFEEDSDWHIEGDATFEYEARFSERRGLFFNGASGASCTQQVMEKISSGVFTLHFFLKGCCGLIIQDQNGLYWNGDERILSWAPEEFINRFDSSDWDDVFCFIILGSDIRQLTVKFVSLESEEAYIDYARLFVKPLNPSYTIVIQYEGYVVTDKTMHLGIGTEDPSPEIDYKKESYLDHSYIVGRKGSFRSEVYKSVLDTVRPRGIQAFVESVERIQED